MTLNSDSWSVSDNPTWPELVVESALAGFRAYRWQLREWRLGLKAFDALQGIVDNFVLTQVVGAWGAAYYSPHGSHALALYLTVVLLLPGLALAVLLREMLSVGFDFGYATILVVTIPANFVVWYCCALLIRKIRQGVFKGPAKQA